MKNKEEKIVIAANELLKNSNYQQMSTAKIAKSAGVAEGTLYRYFKNKDDIFVAAVNYSLGDLYQLFYTDISKEYSLSKNLEIVANNVYSLISKSDDIYKVYYKAFSEIENPKVKSLLSNWLVNNFNRLKEIFLWAIEKEEIHIKEEHLSMVINLLWGTTELLIREAALGIETKSFNELKSYIQKIECIISFLDCQK